MHTQRYHSVLQEADVLHRQPDVCLVQVWVCCTWGVHIRTCEKQNIWHASMSDVYDDMAVVIITRVATHSLGPQGIHVGV